MNGMIFAAGIGSRLAPLTNERPKALVDVAGTPLIKRAIDNMYKAGVKHLVINVHHHAQMIIEYLKNNNNLWPKLNISISDESDMLLETGGGLKKALPLFNNEGAIIVGNADVVSNIDLKAMYENHITQHNDATLLMSNRESTRGLIFDTNNRLMGWTNKAKGEEKIAREATRHNTWAFNGFHIIEQRVIKAMPQKDAFGIIDGYLSVAKEYNIMAYLPKEEYHWFDVGTVEKLRKVEAFLG